MKLNGSVGRMARNKKEDITLVQEAFGHLKVQTKFGRKPLWPRKPDGRNSKDFEAAIACFQDLHKLKATGKLDAYGPGLSKLKMAVPASFRNAQGVRGTTATVSGPANPYQVAAKVAAAVRKSAPFPVNERATLADGIARTGDVLGICLSRKKDWITNDGRFATELKIDSQVTGAITERNQVIRQICSTICFGGVWERGNDTNLQFRSKLKIAALGTNEPLNAMRLKPAGLNRVPQLAIARQCVNACLRIVETGVITTQAGQKDIALLVQALATSDGQIANVLEKYGALQAGNIFKPKEKQILLVVAKLRTVDTTNAEAMRVVIDEFWHLLKACGDPIADLALDLNDGQFFEVDPAAIILKAYLGDQYLKQVNPPGPDDKMIIHGRSGTIIVRIPNDAWRKQQRLWVEQKFREIQRDVALRHWFFASRDEEGIKGNLRAEQLRKYHEDLFMKKYGLPPEAFGGSFAGIQIGKVFGEDVGNFVNSLLEWFWCTNCDEAVERVD